MLSIWPPQSKFAPCSAAFTRAKLPQIGKLHRLGAGLRTSHWVQPGCLVQLIFARSFAIGASRALNKWSLTGALASLDINEVATEALQLRTLLRQMQR